VITDLQPVQPEDEAPKGPTRTTYQRIQYIRRFIKAWGDPYGLLGKVLTDLAKDLKQRDLVTEMSVMVTSELKLNLTVTTEKLEKAMVDNSLLTSKLLTATGQRLYFPKRRPGMYKGKHDVKH